MKVSVQSNGKYVTAGVDARAVGSLSFVTVAALVLFGACASNDPAAPSASTGGVAASAAGMSAAVATPAAAGATSAAAGASSAAAGASSVAAGASSAAAGASSPAVAGSSAAAGAAAPSGPATFTAVVAILADPRINCGLCHGMMMIGGGLLFKPADDKQGTYAALVGPVSKGTDGSQCAGKTYVVPGQPDASLLWDKLSKVTPSCGARMPANGAVLTDAELATVRAWIMAGAMND
jgi:hypothetical protein